MGESVIQSQKVMVGQRQAHYLKAGEGLPVVLLHGGASDSRDWVGTMSALSHRYTLYAPDLIGFGQSERSDDGYYLSDFCEFAAGFIQAVGLDSFVLVGHSLGGRISVDIALRYPERVRKLVLLNSMGFGNVARLGNFLGAATWALRKLWRQSQPYPRFLTGDGERDGWNCLEQLPGVKVPSLLVWKRFDTYVPVSMGRKAAALIPHAHFVVFPGFGHAPHVQNGNTFNRLLSDFLDAD